jgi:hypothetical protein
MVIQRSSGDRNTGLLSMQQVLDTDVICLWHHTLRTEEARLDPFESCTGVSVMAQRKRLS